ncbi:MAG TPA: hypothetical protein VIK04_20240 [Solirubrobacteraceae bacterium]
MALADIHRDINEALGDPAQDGAMFPVTDPASGETIAEVPRMGVLEMRAAFVRVMVLPRELLGRSSIQYVRDGDQDRPKPQRYQVFVDEPLDL